MNTNKDNRDYDRDKEQQNQDRDQKQQSQDRVQNQDADHIRGYGGQAQQNKEDEKKEQQKDHDKDPLKSQNPERLQDDDHRMDKRTNPVEDGDTYDQKLENDSDANLDTESHWNKIKGDYRKRYPNVTDEDVDYRTGEFDNMTDRIAKRTNRKREDVYNEIRDWDSSSQNS